MEIETSSGPARVVLEGVAERPDGGGQAGSGRPSFLLALTHGAGGDVTAPDLLAVRDAALRLGGAVALVTQPYRVRGARAPGSAVRQDAAWAEIITALRDAVGQRAGPGEMGPAGMGPGGMGPAEMGPAGMGPAGMGPAGMGPAGMGPAGMGPAGMGPGEMGPAGMGPGGMGPAGMGPGEMLPLVQGGRSNGARVACRTAVAVGAAAVIALAFPLHPPGHPDRSRAAELRIPGTKLLIVNGDRDPFGVPGRRAGARVVVLAGETHALSRNPAAVGAAVASWLPRALGLDRASARKSTRRAWKSARPPE